MKKLITVVLLIVGMTISAQTPFLGFSLGLYNQGETMDKPFDGNFRGEFKGGVEFHSLRYSIMIEVRPTLDYTKITWIALDYRIDDFPLRRFGTYIGLEGATMYVVNDNPDPTDAYNYRRHTSSNPFNLGANLEVQYNLFRGRVFPSLGLNIFRAEQSVIHSGRDLMWDATVGIYVKF